MAQEQALHCYVVEWLSYHDIHSMLAGKPGEKHNDPFNTSKCLLKYR